MRRRKPFPGASAYNDRHGKRRWRYRKGNFSAELGSDYGSEDFIRRYEAAVEEKRTKGLIGSNRTIPGSFSALLASWYQTTAYKRLRPQTARNYRRILERFREEHGHRQVAHMRPRHVSEILSRMSDTPFAADRLRKLLRQVMKHAVQIEMRSDNPVDHIDFQAPKTDGYHTWSEDEISAFFRRHPEGSLAYRAMTLMLYTGAARVDAVRIGWGSVKSGRISFRRQKTGERVDIPMHSELKRLVDTLPADSFTFLETAHGKSRSSNGLGNLMRRWCNEAGLPECTAHGLRKAMARRLAEAGASTHQIKAIIGDKSLSMVSLYTAEADRSANADRGFERLTGALEPVEKVTNLSKKFANSKRKPLKEGK